MVRTENGGDTVTIDSANVRNLVAGLGDDEIILGENSAVRIIYELGDGADTISGFMDGPNLIQIDKAISATIDSFATLKASFMSQVEDDVLISFGEGQSITLTDVTIGELTPTDFSY